MGESSHHHDLCGLALPCDRPECTQAAVQKRIAEIKEQVRKHCSEEEWPILEARFGFTDGICHGIEETAKKCNVTGDRIRVLEKEIFKKICY